jgi:Domain of unknown function (DUF4157)/Protein of unknown function (DUF2778)
VHDVLSSAGTSLDARTLDVMQRRFGTDLNRVRVHTGEQAAASARAVNAHAYTVGTSIVFDTGRYAPHDPDGRRLLAHELVHTLQQGTRGRPASGEHLGVDRLDSAAEHEAREIAAAASDSETTPAAAQAESLASADTLGAHAPAWQPAGAGLLAGAASASDAWALAPAAGVLQRQPSQAQEQAAMPRTDLTIHVTTGTTQELLAERDRLRAVQTADAATLTSAEAAELSRSLGRLEVLIAERGNSTLADAGVELVFDGTELRMLGSGTTSFAAVSGRPGPDGRFDYSAERQHLERVGPIPEGSYWLDPRELRNLAIQGLLSAYAAAWGSHRITIHPFDTTHTFGRGGFFIHGGTVPGSAGCIDLTTNVARFAALISAVPPGQKVKLRVNYPRLGDYPTSLPGERAA